MFKVFNTTYINYQISVIKQVPFLFLVLFICFTCLQIYISLRRVDRETDHRQGNGIIIVDDLECLGTEDDISECKAREWGTHNCGHDEDIAVICSTFFVYFSALHCYKVKN